MKQVSLNYKTTKDYEQLHRLLVDGHSIIGFKKIDPKVINYYNIDLIEIKIRDNWFILGNVSFCKEDFDINGFCQVCKDLQLEWIEPDYDMI